MTKEQAVLTTGPVNLKGTRKMYTRSNLASIRVKKDISELSSQQFVCGQARTQIEYPDGPNNMLKLIVTINMLEGLYQGGHLSFSLDIPSTYPFHPPKVTCSTPSLPHPNINPHTGEVQLAILTHDWRPVLSITTVIFGLQLLFLEPSMENAINTGVAAQIINNLEMFQHSVRNFISLYATAPTKQHYKRKRSGCNTSRSLTEGELKTNLEAMHISTNAVKRTCTEKSSRMLPNTMEETNPGHNQLQPIFFSPNVSQFNFTHSSSDRVVWRGN